MKPFFLNRIVQLIAPVVIFLWFKSLRLTFSGVKIPVDGIAAFWHRHIFAVIAYLSGFTRERYIAALVSGSSDGKLLQSVLKVFHFNIVEGSSGEGGFLSLLYLERNLLGDEILLITPDGPKGPPDVLKPGVLYLARVSGKKISAVHVRYEKTWALKSWDGAIIPKPFSKCEIVFSEPMMLNRDASDFEITEFQHRLESNLHGYQTHRRMEESLN